MDERPDDEPTGDDRDIVAFLAGIPLFASLDRALRQEVAAAAEVVQIPAGSYLFRAGDPGDAMYAVRSGRLEVQHATDGAVVGVLGPGAAVGELALLAEDERTASVKAIRDSELIGIDRQRFHQLLTRDATFAAALTTVLGRRLAATMRTDQPVPARRNVVSVVTLSAGIPTERITAHLQRVIAGWQSVGLLEAPSPTSAAPSHESAWGAALDRAEAAHEVVILAASEEDDDAWRDFCLRHGDRVLLIVDPTAHPPRTIDEHAQGRDLAFYGLEPPTADAVRRWNERLAPQARHWLPQGPGSTAGIERASRRIFGRSVGVVFSGGGARGLAHIGVMAALVDAGVRVDRFGGTSVGALISALFATGRSADEVREVAREELAHRRPFGDFTFPRKALIRSYRGRRMMHRVFEDMQVEELPHDWFAISADLMTGESLVHRSGPLRHIVSASMSLPGLVPPLPWAGRLLVDGGVVDNLPVQAMADTQEGPVIAVEVMRRWRDEWELRVTRTSSEVPGVLPRSRVPVPSIVETIMCSTVLGSWRQADIARERATLMVVPELQDLGLLDWKRIDEAANEGALATRQALSGADASVRTLLGID